MQVGVDFDHTLFNTDGFYSHVENRLETDIGRVKTTVQDIVTATGEYCLETHAERLDVSPDALEEAYSTAPQYLYNPGWLQEQAEDHRILIVTRDSHTGWQDVKTRYAGLHAHDNVADVRVVAGEETKYFDDIDVLIDDSADEIHAVEDRGITGIYLDRDGNAAMDGRGVQGLETAAERLDQLDGTEDQS